MGVPRGVVLAVIGAQFCVPLVALVASAPPTRLGFQMYSGQGGVDITVVGEDGEEMEPDLADVLAVPMRPEIDWTVGLPEALCAAEPGAARVTIARTGENSRTLEC